MGACREGRRRGTAPRTSRASWLISGRLVTGLLRGGFRGLLIRGGGSDRLYVLGGRCGRMVVCHGASSPASADQKRRCRNVTLAPAGPRQITGISTGSSSDAV